MYPKILERPGRERRLGSRVPRWIRPPGGAPAEPGSNLSATERPAGGSYQSTGGAGP